MPCSSKLRNPIISACSRCLPAMKGGRLPAPGVNGPKSRGKVVLAVADLGEFILFLKSSMELTYPSVASALGSLANAHPSGRPMWSKRRLQRSAADWSFRIDSRTLATMHRRFSAPLPPQHGQRFEDLSGKAE